MKKIWETFACRSCAELLNCIRDHVRAEAGFPCYVAIKSKECPICGTGGDFMKNADKLLELYQKAINEIDDYFEYRYDSGVDRGNVYLILEKLKCGIQSVVDPVRRKAPTPDSGKGASQLT